MMKFSNIYIFGDSLSLCSHLKIDRRWVEILKLKIKNKNEKIVRIITQSNKLPS